MGCDGGTIPKRDELVRTKKKGEQKDKVSQLNFLWRHCSISQTPLRDPIVACGLGKLYNKDSVIMSLLEKANMPETIKHIKNIKDIKELKLTPNPAYAAGIKKGDSYDDHQSAPYICPLVGIEMNGKFKFCFNWNCGCVLSERAVKELKSNVCHKCQNPVSEDDLVVLNAEGDDLDLNRTRLESRQARLKAARKIKKEPQQSVEVKVEPDSSETADREHKPGSSKVVADSSKPSSKLAKVSSKRGPTGRLDMQVPDFKKTKGDYSVASDPNATPVYKSLFTSCNEAKQQDRAHWITYNPFYN